MRLLLIVAEGDKVEVVMDAVVAEVMLLAVAVVVDNNLANHVQTVES